MIVNEMRWIMLDVLKSNIDELKKRVQFNLEIIGKNEKRIRELLQEPVSEARAKNLNRRFEYNNRLLEENKDAIQLQREIIQFMEKHHIETEGAFYPMQNNEDYISIKESLTREDYFELTANKTLDFDQEHPYYNDKEFLNELIAFFVKTEDYEMCSLLVKS